MKVLVTQKLKFGVVLHFSIMTIQKEGGGGGGNEKMVKGHLTNCCQVCFFFHIFFNRSIKVGFKKKLLFLSFSCGFVLFIIGERSKSSGEVDDKLYIAAHARIWLFVGIYMYVYIYASAICP